MWNDLENPAFVTAVWAESEDIDAWALVALFEAANEVCVAYAPHEVVAPYPMTYMLAEIMQARHIWTQFRGGNRDEMGPDGLSLPVYPLVFAARDLLRPKRNPLSRLR